MLNFASILRLNKYDVKYVLEFTNPYAYKVNYIWKGLTFLKKIVYIKKCLEFNFLATHNVSIFYWIEQKKIETSFVNIKSNCRHFCAIYIFSK